MAAATTASTVAAGAFIGSSMVAGGVLMMADYSSGENFANSADWWTVGSTAVGAVVGGAYGYAISPKTPQGQWHNVNESMSKASRDYQTQITGRTGQSYVVNGVKFDGVSS
ncbi:hypothetical protein SDC9_111045 [bioreactor metagenome]|uniref:Uncharacterized protein n=1 Tax=bioreactor metagenome TaxID=1076179 RepID=A0A645BFC8_9ZZZZ|nr:hypothetical protein [Oscillospiraceae bacterium]